ncbi:DNA-binding protein [Thermoanaerobacterium thermosaccharolyticum]|nr:DNA-binding protein [Thermoanaerobacterium thermosaccharolyticum]
MHSLNEVVLTVEEFEAIRLKDLEGLEQEECAEKMKVSRPTFFRIIISAREKVADALVNGKAIKVEGGNYKVYGDDTVHHGHCHRHGMDINEDE